MSRLLPKTLFGRMVLIMVAGFIIAHLLGLLIFFQERDRLNTRTSARFFGARIGEIVKIIDHLPPAQRASLAAEISSPDLAISTVDAPTAAPRDGPQYGEVAAIISQRLRRYLGESREIRVQVTDDADDFDPYHPSRAVAKQVTAQIRLAEGDWIGFTSDLAPPPGPPPSSRLIFDIALRLVTVIVLSLIAVRFVTRPLSTLASAAEALGRDIHHPPLDEKGTVEVRRAAHAFNTMQARLIEYIQERTRILAAVSHDLKTPITRLRLRTELLHDLEVQAKFARDLEEMEAMVSATLDFTRGLDQVEAQREVDVMALLESLQADAQDMGKKISIDGDTRRPIKAYPQSLKRCISNLLENAVKFGSEARVSVEDSGQMLVIRISDDGPGVPEAEMGRVFEPFYRVEASRNRATGGTGLGLSIARNNARAQGGDVTMRNRPEGGLEVTLTLPRTV
jgi:signal transduction histidine kinase